MLIDCFIEVIKHYLDFNYSYSKSVHDKLNPIRCFLVYKLLTVDVAVTVANEHIFIICNLFLLATFCFKKSA